MPQRHSPFAVQSTEEELVLGGHCGSRPSDRPNERRLIAWGLAWAVTWAGASLAIKWGWLPSGAPAVAATILSTLLGVGQIVAYRRLLREADELRRQIELEAMAFSLGVGVVGGFGYWLLAQSGTVSEPDVLWVLLAMVAVYPLGLVFGYRRFR
jgi:hypothetical protein